MTDNRHAPLSLSENPRQNFAKKPRGRPQGSKNKPKPNSIIKEVNNTLMEPILIEIPLGRDIVESLISLARSHQAGINVLCGSGLVYDVTLLHPITRVPDFPIIGPIYMISLTGYYINSNNGQASTSSSTINASKSYFSISLSDDGQGQIFGGVVGGKLMAAGNVLITAALVKEPKFDRLGINNENLH